MASFYPSILYTLPSHIDPLLRTSNLYIIMKRGRSSRGRTSTRANTGDRGGIRKRGAPPTKVDRDGDLAMGAGAGAIRGQKTRSGSGRPASSATRANTALDRSISQIQKALSSSNAQANIRQGGRASPTEQVAVRGWKESKAASNRDGGVESLVAFLEKKLTSPDSKSGPRVRISKVCATLLNWRPPT